MIGLLSGTSIDGVDVAAATFGQRGDELTLTPLGHREYPYDDALSADLRAALPPGPCDAETLTRLDTRVGRTFAEAASTAVDELAGGHADLVASLGQTVFHWVEHGRAEGTLQIGRPAWIAERTGLPVVADLRARDVAAGGHGAPLASTLDALWLRHRAETGGVPAAAVNLGGIANLTVVRPDGATAAYDTGPGNALLDVAAAEVTGGTRHQDRDGALAAAGTVRPDLLSRLTDDPYYAREPPKSTGREYFHRAYLRSMLDGLPEVGGADLLATLTELTALTVTDACRAHGVRTVVASGGGLRNPSLVHALRRRIHVVASDDLGLPSDAKEAYLTALLGWLTWHGLPATVPEATGARGPRLLGSITPGAGPLALPAVAARPVTRLRIAHPDTP